MSYAFTSGVLHVYVLVQGKSYFTCPDNHGIFVRQSQLTVLTDVDVSPPAQKASSRLPSLGIPKPGASRIPSTPVKDKAKEERDEVIMINTVHVCLHKMKYWLTAYMIKFIWCIKFFA